MDEFDELSEKELTINERVHQRKRVHQLKGKNEQVGEEMWMGELSNEAATMQLPLKDCPLISIGSKLKVLSRNSIVKMCKPHFGSLTN